MAKSNRKTPKNGKSQVVDQLSKADRATLASAMQKSATGEPLTQREQNLVNRVKKAQEEERRWEHYATIPKKHWREMSGRSDKVINEQAERYGIPFGGRTIDLTEVVPALHDFLAKNKYKLAADDDPMLAGGNSPALERYRTARAKLAERELEEKDRTVIPREEVQEWLRRLGRTLRQAGETLARQFGPDAALVLEEALEEGRRMMREDLP